MVEGHACSSHTRTVEGVVQCFGNCSLASLGVIRKASLRHLPSVNVPGSLLNIAWGQDDLQAQVRLELISS